MNYCKCETSPTVVTYFHPPQNAVKCIIRDVVEIKRAGNFHDFSKKRKKRNGGEKQNSPIMNVYLLSNIVGEETYFKIVYFLKVYWSKSAHNQRNGLLTTTNLFY